MKKANEWDGPIDTVSAVSSMIWNGDKQVRWPSPRKDWISSLISTETGVAFDLETLGGGGGKREKKTATPTTSSTSKDEEKAEGTEKKVVGWQYRYRVSKMLEAQKREGADRATKASSKKVDQLPPHERLDPELARLTPEQRVVGWAYRYVQLRGRRYHPRYILL